MITASSGVEAWIRSAARRLEGSGIARGFIATSAIASTAIAATSARSLSRTSGGTRLARPIAKSSAHSASEYTWKRELA